MRTEIWRGYDRDSSSYFVVYESHWNVTQTIPSSCVWMVPGTWDGM